MLERLREDQAYRARWDAERNKSKAQWARRVTWALGVISAVAVVAAAVVQLIQMF